MKILHNRYVSFMIHHLELIFWMASVIFLFFSDPLDHHFTLCPLKNLGFDHCPGCGLGHSCSFALKGQFVASLQMHPFGIFALMVIGHRIFVLIRGDFHYKQFKIYNL